MMCMSPEATESWADPGFEREAVEPPKARAKERRDDDLERAHAARVIQHAVSGDLEEYQRARRAMKKQASEALDEARLAIETIVLKKRQPVELSTAKRKNIQHQIDLCDAFGLHHVVCSDPIRLRILPPAEVEIVD